MKQTFIFLTLLFSTFVLNAQIINESFEGAWSPNPTGWYQESLSSGTGGGSDIYWQQSVYSGSWTPAGNGEPTGAVTGSSVAWYNDYNAQAGQVDRFATYDIDLSGTTNPVVSFYFYYENGGSIDFKLVASNDGGTSWNDISTSLNETGTVWKKETFFLPAEYKVANARIGFEITAKYGSYDFWLDDVVLIDAPAALTGTKTIDNTQPTAGDNFNSFTDAFDALNISGVGDGGVVFNVAEGQTFSENPPQLTVTGTDVNQIVFQNSGTPGTNNPKIEAAGTGSDDYTVKLHETNYVTFNGIDIYDATTNFNPDLRIENGFILEDNSSHNIIKNCTIDLSKANSNFSVAITTRNGGNNNNKFLNNTITDCSGGYFLGDVSDVVYDQNNTIDIENGGQSSITDIGLTNTSLVSYFVKFNYQQNFVLANTQMSGIAVTQSPAYGVYCNDGLNVTSEIHNNTISGIAKTETVARYVAGIYLSAGNHNVYQNKINNISNNSGDVVGIDVSSYGDSYFYQNDISDINYSGASNYFSAGICVDISSAKKAYIYNNIIYDLKAENGITDNDTPVNCAGIYTKQGKSFIYFNTILLNYTANNSTNVSAALFSENHYTEYDIRNNIFVNNVSGTYSKAISFFHNSDDYSDILNTTDNNLHFAGSPSVSNLIFYNGTTSYQTIENYKAHVANFDQLSNTEDVNFISETTPYDLHINTTIPTIIESGAFPVNSPIAITSDFDNNTRNATTPDIGAFEGDYTILDLAVPSITYGKIKNTTSTENYSLTGFAEIVDASGIDVITNKPRLYFKNKDDSNTFAGNTSADNGWKFVEATNTTSPFEFTIDYSIIYGGLVEKGDIIEYFVVAQDMASNPNVGANPHENFSANSVSDIVSAPTNPNFYFIADLYYDFESDNDQRFTHEPDFGYTTDDWERGTPTGGDFYPTSLPSGVKCWGTKLDANYSGSAAYFLYSPMFEATDDLFIFDFSEFLYLDLIQFDNVVLEYRVNNFLWYPFSDAYSRKDTEWSNQIYSLNVNPGDRIEIRWKIDTDLSTEYAGWFIDDLLVRGATISYNVNFTVVNEDSQPVSYPHIWIDGATGNDYWIGEQDGKKTINLANGEHSYRINGPHEYYDYAEDNYTVADDDLDILVVLYNYNNAVNNIDDNNINIHPNPASNYFIIDKIDRNKSYEISITNILGKQVYKKSIKGLSELRVNTNNFSKGLYNVSIVSDNKQESRKVIIK